MPTRCLARLPSLRSTVTLERWRRTMSNRRLVYCLATGASLAGPIGLAAQAPLARGTVGGGSATEPRGRRSGAYSLAPSLTLFPAADLTLGLGGRTTRYTSNEWSLGGSAGLSARVPLGPRPRLRVGAGGGGGVRPPPPPPPPPDRR